ncbi:MAG: bifunctional riboflavin kinase/FAD synthetase [Melioribacter sp.]|uniref:bifunctional riboflavin kinase/FAD synthetase n=1 Tax=Rosettibacter primus TaxID=3111523 RepID=UPI00247BC68D|nr:bifunctional riboflavin kinase/FAD synthetase [Melioribacter sp.]
MKIFKDSSEFKKDKKTVITVGSFDGLHIGHQKILKKLLELSKEINGTSVLLTFEPHPRSVIAKDFNLKILTTLDEKKLYLEKFGIDNLIVQNFTLEFSQMTSEEFIKKILVNDIGVSHIVIGHDHKFGKDRLGDEEKLKEFGRQHNFNVTSVEAEMIDGQIVSSTKIRKALNEGNIEKVNLFLGRNYKISGKIVEGTKRGRELGFPTANIKLHDERKAIPKNGVYVVSCVLKNKNYYGVMNIGIRPTFENNNQTTLEVNLFDFNRNVYGEDIEVKFIKYIRDEKKFESKEDLINQIRLDIKTAKEIIEGIN